MSYHANSEQVQNSKAATTVAKNLTKVSEFPKLQDNNKFKDNKADDYKKTKRPAETNKEIK